MIRFCPIWADFVQFWMGKSMKKDEELDLFATIKQLLQLLLTILTALEGLYTTTPLNQERFREAFTRARNEIEDLQRRL